MMMIMDEDITIGHALKTRCSIARFGDGEFKNAMGRNCKPQARDDTLTVRLKEILISTQKDCLICVPRVFNGNYMPGEPGIKTHDFWQKIAANETIRDMISDRIVYGSMFITRPDCAPHTNNFAFHESFKRLWAGDDVVFVTGEEQMSKHPALFDNCTVIGSVKCPIRDAFFQYDSILERCLAMPEDATFIIRLGPTATVLAYDLSVRGRRALDIGHYPMFFNRFMQSYQGMQEAIGV